MAVFDTMRHIRPHVSTTCVGLAASMAAFLLASGEQVSIAPKVWYCSRVCQCRLSCLLQFFVACCKLPPVPCSLPGPHKGSVRQPCKTWVSGGTDTQLSVQGKRYSLPNSRIMIHQPLGGAQGQAADIEIQVRQLCHALHLATCPLACCIWSGQPVLLQHCNLAQHAQIWKMCCTGQ